MRRTAREEARERVSAAAQCLALYAHHHIRLCIGSSPAVRWQQPHNAPAIFQRNCRQRRQLLAPSAAMVK